MTITAVDEFSFNGHDGSLICRHRDLTCCQICADAHSEILAVEGAHFWMTGETEIKALADFYKTTI